MRIISTGMKTARKLALSQSWWIGKCFIAMVSNRCMVDTYHIRSEQTSQIITPFGFPGSIDYSLPPTAKHFRTHWLSINWLHVCPWMILSLIFSEVYFTNRRCCGHCIDRSRKLNFLYRNADMDNDTSINLSKCYAFRGFHTINSNVWQQTWKIDNYYYSCMAISACKCSVLFHICDCWWQQICYKKARRSQLT